MGVDKDYFGNQCFSAFCCYSYHILLEYNGHSNLLILDFSQRSTIIRNGARLIRSLLIKSHRSINKLKGMKYKCPDAFWPSEDSSSRNPERDRFLRPSVDAGVRGLNYNRREYYLYSSPSLPSGAFSQR